MRKKTTHKKNSATTVDSFYGLPVFPGIICKAPDDVKTVKALPDYRLEVTFLDGTHGFVEMTLLINSEDAGVFATLRDVEFFNKAFVYYGAVTWPNEVDLAPDAMHDEIKKHGTWILS